MTRELDTSTDARRHRAPPEVLETERLLIRRWEPTDATRLAPILDANVEHLKPWIPWSVAEPATVPELERRLASYSASFSEDREWLYALIANEDLELLGGIGLYPRDAERRVASRAADRVEIGYWIRRDATGRGYVTEAVRRLIEVARSIPHFTSIEIRCDPRNAESNAIPRRLGFRAAHTIVAAHTEAGASVSETIVWKVS